MLTSAVFIRQTPGMPFKNYNNNLFSYKGISVSSGERALGKPLHSWPRPILPPLWSLSHKSLS